MNEKQRQFIWLRAAILLAMFVLALTSLRGKSPTFDEQGFLTRGVAYLRGENQQIRVGHPLGLNALNAIFLSADDQVVLPTSNPSWSGTNFHRPSELFMWEIGNDVDRIMFLGRLPTIWLGMLLVAVAGRWAWEMSGRDLAAGLAMLLLALDPNILAHTRLATTDLGLAAMALLAAYLLWRFWRRPSWTRALLAGGAFGLLVNTKFTAGLFAPLFALVILVMTVDRWRTYHNGSASPGLIWRPLGMLVISYPLAGFLVLWASYGFQIGTLPADLPMLSSLADSTLPLSHYLEQLLDIGGRMQKPTPAFLWGQYSDSGWWYYFPVAFILKTPLPALIMLAWAIGRLLLCIFRRLGSGQCLTALDGAILLIPSMGYFASALTTDINLGYRHLLPILPPLFVLIGVMLSGIDWRSSDRFPALTGPRLALTGLLVWFSLAALWIYPHYLSFFNVLAGGPTNGWNFLVDSNIDWGQDLAGLKAWMDENAVDQLWLSYFGEGRPDYYDIDYRGLDSYPPRLMDPEAQPFYPPDPAPGIYAISVTNLQGVHFDNRDQFAWFRKQEPLDNVGHSILLYDVPSRGRPVDLALAGLQLEALEPEDHAMLSTNDVSAHWFDASQSLLIPHAHQGWLAIANDVEVDPRVAEELEGWPLVRQNDDYRLYRRPAIPEPGRPYEALFSSDSGSIGLVEASATVGQQDGRQRLELVTRWLKQAPAEPIKIFVHVVDDEDEIVAQWDGLGAQWQGWLDQDELLQLHEIQMPEDVPPGDYELWIGLYEPASGLRWQTELGDRWLIGELAISR